MGRYAQNMKEDIHIEPEEHQQGHDRIPPSMYEALHLTSVQRINYEEMDRLKNDVNVA